MSSSDGLSTIEFDFCKEITEKLLRHNLCMDFVYPVPDEVPNYRKVIAHPMDLGTISEKLKHREYKTAMEWKSDIMLVWDNAMKYNPPDTGLHKVAQMMKDKSLKMTRIIPKSEMDLWHVQLMKASDRITKCIQNAPPTILPRVAKATQKNHR